MSFLTSDQIQSIRAEFGTPVYVYDETLLEAAAHEVLAFPNAYGLTARYAMKALPTAAIVRVLTDAGLSIDASSGFEAERAIRAGVAAEKIQLTTQELPKDLKGLVERGVWFNACSLAQLEAYGRLFPGSDVSVRMNPGLGTGHNNRTNTGGQGSSFGIWHEKLDEIRAIEREFDLSISRVHTHIGSGGDPEVWQNCARMSLALVAEFPRANRVSLGGGFKIARMPGENSANLQEIGQALIPDFEAFAKEHGRELHLEIEPGTFPVANAGLILANVIDVVDTGDGGYRFIKVDTGMTELLRPNLYGAQHPISVVPAGGEEGRGQHEYLVAGHCCESGDMMTCEPGNPEVLLPRTLCEARPGDSLVIEGAGAYCSGLAGKNYNSFPEAPEVLVSRNGTPKLIRQRQTMEQMLANELLD